MTVRIYGNENTAAYGAAKALVGRLGHTVTDVTCMADLAIAPLLTEILPAEVLGVPVYGTLIFHPREFYEQDILPAMLRTLERALKDIAEGHLRKVPQVEKYSTYDKKL